MEDIYSTQKVKEALANLPKEYKELVRKRGDLQVAINDAREWGDDTTRLKEQLREINDQISKY